MGNAAPIGARSNLETRNAALAESQGNAPRTEREFLDLLDRRIREDPANEAAYRSALAVPSQGTPDERVNQMFDNLENVERQLRIGSHPQLGAGARRVSLREQVMLALAGQTSKLQKKRDDEYYTLQEQAKKLEALKNLQVEAADLSHMDKSNPEYLEKVNKLCKDAAENGITINPELLTSDSTDLRGSAWEEAKTSIKNEYDAMRDKAEMQGVKTRQAQQDYETMLLAMKSFHEKFVELDKSLAKNLVKE